MTSKWRPTTRTISALRYDQPTRRAALRLAANWLARTVEEHPAVGCGWRDLQLDLEGAPLWRAPRSGTGERINVLLAAHQTLGDERYRHAACHYAQRMLGDPQWGIYDGPEELMRGACHHSLVEPGEQESPDYASVYSMRLPRAFAALADATGDQRYARWFATTAAHLLKIMLPMGLPIPWFYWGKQPSSDPVGQVISIRVGYLAGEFAWLSARTGDQRFAAAARQIVQWMGKTRDETGRWPEGLSLERGQAFGAHRSNHMLCYILTGLARAARILNLDEARALTRSAADDLLNQFERYHRVPAIPDAAGLAVRPDWALSPMYDSPLALLEAGRTLNDPHCLAVADELALQFIARQAVDESHPSAGAAPYFSPPTTTGYLQHPRGGWNCDGHSTAWMAWFFLERDQA